MDVLGQGIIIAIIGVFVVGMALALISGVLYLLKYVGGNEKKAAEQKVVPVQPPAPAPVSEQAAEKTSDDKEVVAAILAAIAASMNTSADKLIVRSFKRVEARK